MKSEQEYPKTINQIAARLRGLASEVGGNHYTNKETEEILRTLADRLGEININISDKMNECIESIDLDYTGVSYQYRQLYRRNKNIAENAAKDPND